MRILAVDAGNSRIKWGLREDQEWLMLGATNHTEIDSLAQTPFDATIPGINR